MSIQEASHQSCIKTLVRLVKKPEHLSKISEVRAAIESDKDAAFKYGNESRWRECCEALEELSKL